MAYQAVVNDVGVIETQSLNAYSASHPWLLTVQTGTVPTTESAQFDILANTKSPRPDRTSNNLTS